MDIPADFTASETRCESILDRMAPISAQIWDSKYRLKTETGAPIDQTVEDMWQRVARALADVEKDPVQWEAPFYDALRDFRFIPAGRILSGAGTERRVTLFNCFVMGDIEDDLGQIFTHLREAALTMQQGGGIGYDFSSLRPKGALVRGVGADASGPLSFMDVWDSMCRTIMSAGARRGAMMAVMRCDHPDIEDFIAAKREPGRLRNFNLSVLVTDDFMKAVELDSAWDLVFAGKTYRTLRARDLWDKITRATYEYAEPGVIFIDRINKRNNLYYCETIHATNPCGEQPLPPYGACLLGSINLARLVRDPFEDGAHIDETELAGLVATAIRMMDNTIDASGFPLEQQRKEADAKRRIGLGMTGLADALMMCGLRYGTVEAAAQAKAWAKQVERAAYLASAKLAKEKGAFPLYDRVKYLAGETISGLDEDVRAAISQHGIRNALLTSIAPTGTISLVADNVSSGVEPVFALAFTRKVLQRDGTRTEEEVTDYALRLWRAKFGADTALPDYFVTAQDLNPSEHVRMQAAVQAHVDSAISKTVNVPEDISFEAFQEVYLDAYRSGCKGCTTYRPNAVTGSVLEVKPQTSAVPAPQAIHDDVSGLLVRADRLVGATYKLRWPDSEHAMYVTINDIEQDGVRRPFEIFVNSKNLEHYAWVVALTRMISAVFRRGGEVAFVAEELKQVFDPRGGQWAQGRYVPSLVAAIGDVIERHMLETGFLTLENDRLPVQGKKAEAAVSPLGSLCPKCSQPGLVREAGCLSCLQCGWSKCG
ncbi:adenosylcobalamin-dependent ribonucleoside-diphosphate reductase [Acidocella aminolytica]|uniref:Vitamin B12-dependent ribonucleotide reductase n=1 Tax=Acidocella aminolytica 101 = DSM 11237 TaxID=1120923 RepID=A0A0D6PCR9_9PROT|nr:adenosylcobalamin-dependent ribonucleoside-diphosphate reductase [Acidocella aminolytica]GAN79126.1 vitamin B12-dependent ribonucleotide reductase [Acidocella aminolytica 101 = DSM 11237]GBQ43742.1 ribonucleotide-diphosphate reductase subunit alpha [Acidocella aminolytica 101 = DSM 11237]SHE65591.1 ribonucleoside-diphosphate reductase class II [Acidocella aminolytica 101 = DSM 11237]